MDITVPLPKAGEGRRAVTPRVTAITVATTGHRKLIWLKSMFHLSVGVYHLRKRRFDRAAACFSEVIGLSPDYAVAYMNRGVAFQYMNDHRRAIGDFDQAIALSLRLGSGRTFLAGMFERISVRGDQGPVEKEAHSAIVEFRYAVETFFALAGKRFRGRPPSSVASDPE